MLPTLFVGSSTEALPIAEAVQRNIRHVATVTLWTQGVFGLNKIAFETIVNKAKYFDYAVFIFSTDDNVSIRGLDQEAVRDNVIFELGFFLRSSRFKALFLFSSNNPKLVSNS